MCMQSCYMRGRIRGTAGPVCCDRSTTGVHGAWDLRAWVHAHAPAAPMQSPRTSWAVRYMTSVGEARLRRVHYVDVGVRGKPTAVSAYYGTVNAVASSTHRKQRERSA
jgi:hypothetical protein